MAKISLLLQK